MKERLSWAIFVLRILYRNKKRSKYNDEICYQYKFKKEEIFCQKYLTTTI